jgi:hypothetical protein
MDVAVENNGFQSDIETGADASKNFAASIDVARSHCNADRIDTAGYLVGPLHRLSTGAINRQAKTGLAGEGCKAGRRDRTRCGDHPAVSP